MEKNFQRREQRAKENSGLEKHSQEGKLGPKENIPNF